MANPTAQISALSHSKGDVRNTPVSIGFLILTGVLFSFIALCIGCESLEDHDQRHLRKHFNLTKDTVLLDFAHQPVTRGPREGLRIQASYQLSEEQFAKIMNEGQKLGWRALPLPETLLSKLPFNDLDSMNIPFEPRSGFFLCKTAGDNVLRNTGTLCESAETHPICSELMSLEEAKTSDKCQQRFLDQILGIVDIHSQTLFIFVGSSY